METGRNKKNPAASETTRRTRRVLDGAFKTTVNHHAWGRYEQGVEKMQYAANPVRHARLGSLDAVTQEDFFLTVQGGATYLEIRMCGRRPDPWSETDVSCAQEAVRP